MPDNWRDKLAALEIEPMREVTEADLQGVDLPDFAAEHGDEIDRKFIGKPEWEPHYDESIRANSTPPESIMAHLDADAVREAQAKILERVLTETGRTIREPHLTHQERQDRLRGIPAIGSVGGAIKGTRPDHA